ncbi:hypothetical protein FSP39_016559, partial [Pinctada imbricata]
SHSIHTVYGYGTLANIACCLCSLGGAVILPCAKRYEKAYKVVLAIFMGLAVGTLASDAMLHLLPEAFGLHSHEEHEEGDGHGHEEEEEGIHVEKYVWFALITLLGIYMFYLLEMVMTYIQGRYGMIETTDSADDPTNLAAINDGPSQNFNKMTESTTELGLGSTSSNLQTQTKKTKYSPLVIMIIVGDAIHNFADGLAIAAAFSKSNIDGLSITIAIFCHELPHELGDFAVLMSSGMGYTKALLANLFSSLTALIGFYVGVPISSQEFAKEWIFAITAGMFLYISLVDMLPTLVKHGRGKWRTIIYHNIGILVGALIIILLGIFEDKIHV